MDGGEDGDLVQGLVGGGDGEVFFLDLVGVSGVSFWGVGGELFCEVEAGPGAPDS